MRLLVDTHVWLWLQVEPHRIDGELLDVLADPRHELLLSAASAWEMAIKHALGKLPLPEPPTRYVPDRMQRSGVTPLPVTQRHALAVAELPRHHRDPFDRLLVVQTRQEGAELVTHDAVFDAYDVPVRWARRASPPG